MPAADDDPVARFAAERAARIAGYRDDKPFAGLSLGWLEAAFGRQYMYNWEWMGRPIIQLPADILAMSEIIWQVKPDLIVETGIAHGGSVALNASLLALLELVDALEEGTVLDPSQPRRRVVAVDIDIRAHNRSALDNHPLANRMVLLEGSSLDPAIIAAVHEHARDARRVLVALDSNHTHDHVLEELRAYAPLTSPGSYCVVFDTIIEDLPRDFFPDRPWNPGNSPRTAIGAFLRDCEAQGLRGIDGALLDFRLDSTIDDKLLVTAAPGGFLKRL